MIKIIRVVKNVIVLMFIMYTLLALYGATGYDGCFTTGKDIVVFDNYGLNASQMVNSHFENYGTNILEMNESIIFDMKSDNDFTLNGLSSNEEDSWIHYINSNSSQKVHHFSVFSKADETTIFHNCEKVSVHRFSTDRVFTPVNASAHKWDPVQAFTLNENRELRIKLKPSKMIKFSFYISSEGNCRVKIYLNKEERSPQQFIGSSKLSAEEQNMKDQGYVMWKKMEGSFSNVDGEVLIITNEDPKNGKCFITHIELRNEMDNYITDEDVEMASIFNITTEYFEKEPRTSLPTYIPDINNNIEQKNEVKKFKSNTRAATEKYRKHSSSAESNETAIAIGVSVGILVFAILAMAVVTIQCVKKKRNNAHNNNSIVDPSDEQQRLSNECNGINRVLTITNTT